jgi:hypothetical protein
VGIAKTTTATVSDDRCLAINHQVGQQLTLWTVGHRPHWHGYDQVLTAAAVLTALATGLTGVSRQLFLVAKSRQGVLITTGLQYDVATIATIATIRAAFGYKFLVTEATPAITTMSSGDINSYLINKHISLA